MKKVNEMARDEMADVVAEIAKILYEAADFKHGTNKKRFLSASSAAYKAASLIARLK